MILLQEEEPRVSLEDQFAKGGNSDHKKGTKKITNNPAPSRGDQNTKSR